MTTLSDTTKAIRSFVLAKYDPEAQARLGFTAMTSTELYAWMKANGPDELMAIISAAFKLPSVEQAARLIGVDVAELKEHVAAGDVTAWLEWQGINLAEVAPSGDDPERRAHRERAAREFGFEFVMDAPSGLAHGSGTFETFKCRAGTGDALDAVKAWCRGLGPPLLLLAGVPGNGKTHLLEAAGAVLEQGGEQVLYRTTQRLLKEWRASFDGHGDAPHAFMDVPWLLLDDLMREAGTDWSRATLDELVDHRYSRRMRTLMATNMEKPELPPRLRSRLSDAEIGRIVAMTATDYRPLKGKK